MSKYYQTVEDLDVNLEELIACYEHFKESKGFRTDDKRNIDFNAICVNRIPGDENSLVGPKVRGLYWTYPDTTNHEEKRLVKVEEEKYTELCPEFKDTYVEEVYNLLTKHFKVGRVRFLMKPPRTCLSWHRDPEKRLHIPIITNKGCIMVIEDIAFHMPADGAGYITDNTQYHNFFNGMEQNRVHLVATILDDRKEITIDNAKTRLEQMSVIKHDPITD